MLEIIALAAITNLWVLSEPTNNLRMWLYNDVKDKEQKWHFRMLNCALCSGFWIGLLFTYNLYSAAIVSICAEFIYKKLTEGGL